MQWWLEAFIGMVDNTISFKILFLKKKQRDAIFSWIFFCSVGGISNCCFIIAPHFISCIDSVFCEIVQLVIESNVIYFYIQISNWIRWNLFQSDQSLVSFVLSRLSIKLLSFILFLLSFILLFTSFRIVFEEAKTGGVLIGASTVFLIIYFSTLKNCFLPVKSLVIRAEESFLGDGNIWYKLNIKLWKLLKIFEKALIVFRRHWILNIFSKLTTWVFYSNCPTTYWQPWANKTTISKTGQKKRFTENYDFPMMLWR